MRKAIALASGLAALLVLVAASPAAASPETDAFAAACNANADFFSFAVEGLEADPAGRGRLCSCLITAFTPLPAADLEMLTKDVDDSATEADRTAYGDYTGLEIVARDALFACVAEASLEGGTPAVAEPADMSGFDASCSASEGLLQVIGGVPDEAMPLRTTLCACLSTTIGPQVSTADADVLGMDLDGTATDESRDAHPGYAELTQVAGAAFDGCFSTLRPPAAQ